MKTIKFIFSILLQFGIVLLVAGWIFYQSVSPLKDNLYVEYKTTVSGVGEESTTIHEIGVTQKDKKNYAVHMLSSGFTSNEHTYVIGKNFKDKTGAMLPGPTAAVMWSNPCLLWIGNNVAAGEVIQYRKWRGYSVAVIVDPSLVNCYGFYERKTGIQVGYIIGFSSLKIVTVIGRTNIKGLY